MPAHLRRAIAVAAVGALALLLVAVAQSAAGDPKKRLNAADQARAKSMLLLKSDLPAGRWDVEPTSFNQANPDCVVKHYSLAALTATGEVGFTYTQGIRVIESDARLFLTAKQAARALAIFSAVGLGRCLGSSIAAEIEAASPSVSASVASVESFSFAGLAATVRGVRIAVRLRGSPGLTSLHYALTSVRSGRALATFGLVRENTAWPGSLVRSLAAVTAKRMTKR